jgi:hypothetical protein
MGVVFSSLPVEPLRITSKFGKRNTGISGASTDHKGVDLGRDWKKAETEILSVARGIVSANYWNDYRGWVVTIKHRGFVTLYQHLKAKSPLSVGIEVLAGDVIGVMGASSNKEKLSVATHLHFEVIVDGEQVDPEKYFYHLEDDMTKEEVLKIIEESKTVYEKSSDMPSWAKPTIDRYILKGYIAPNTDGSINLTQEMTRLIVIFDRMLGGGK